MPPFSATTYHLPGLAGLVSLGTGRLPAVSRSLAAFPRTGHLPAAFRSPAADYRAPGLAGTAFPPVPFGVRLPNPRDGVSPALQPSATAFGGRLPCPGDGVDGVSVDWSITSCIPALGGGLPSPGVSGAGVLSEV